MKTLLRLARLIDRVNGLFGKLIPWLVLAAVLISALNAVGRKAFDFSSNAFLEVQWYLFAAVFLLGAGYTFMENAHVRIDVLAGKLSMRARNWIDVTGILVFLLPLCGFMIHLSWAYVWQAYVSGEISQNYGGLIRWPIYALVPLGFGLLGLQALSELIKRFAFLLGAGPNPLPGERDEENVPHHERHGGTTAAGGGGSGIEVTGAAANARDMAAAASRHVGGEAK
jgi:TRAP-type mannitol/chloroaromatic compound transport system permease small subunit